MYEDYEYYSVDPYNPLDPEREITTLRYTLEAFSPSCQKAHNAIAAFLRPRFHVGTLPARMFGDALMTQCKTYEDARKTLLRNPALK